MTLNYKFIGKTVKKYRKSMKISQEELAERIDMSVAYISHIETGRKRVSLETLVKIANILGTTVDQLLSCNQINDPFEYKTDLWLLLEDCSSYEKQIIYEIAVAMKQILRDNSRIQYKNDE